MKARYIYIMMLFLAIFFSGCASKVNGTIYLDQNANGSFDLEDKALGGIFYKVTKDGAFFGNGVTAEDGFFEFKAKGDGFYCITSDAEKYVPAEDEGGEPKSAVSGKAVESQCVGDKDCDKIADAIDNCPDVANFDQADADNNKIGDLCDTTEKAEEVQTVEQTEVYQPNKTCINLNGNKATADVRIAVEFDALLDTTSSVKSIDVNAGLPFGLDIVYPKSCKEFKPLVLPNDLRSGTVWSEDLAVLNVSGSIQAAEGVLLSGSDYDIKKDPLMEKQIQLISNPETINDPDLDYKKIQLILKTSCPDKKTVLTYTYNINVYGNFPIEVTHQELVGDGSDEVFYGKEFQVKYKLKNVSTKEDLRDVRVVVDLPGGTVKKGVTTSDAICDYGGECVIGTFAMGKIIEITFPFKLPENTSRTEFTPTIKVILGKGANERPQSFPPLIQVTGIVDPNA